MIKFANPIFLLFVSAVPVMLFFYIKKHKGQKASMRYSDLGLVKRLKPSSRLKQRHVTIILRSLVIILWLFP